MAKIKREKVKRSEINHAAVAAEAKMYNLAKQTVYLMIHLGALTPSLTTGNDWATLKAIGLVVRNRAFTRQMLARFTRAERQDLLDNAGLTEKEVRIKKCLQAAAEKGKTITTIQICADVYLREGKIYTSVNPDYALIDLVGKIRRSLKNRRHYLVKTDGCPFGPADE